MQVWPKRGLCVREVPLLGEERGPAEPARWAGVEENRALSGLALTRGWCHLVDALQEREMFAEEPLDFLALLLTPAARLTLESIPCVFFPLAAG